MTIEIRILDGSPTHAESLAKLLIEATADGTCLSFMDPLPRDKATAYWDGFLADARKGNLIMFGAFDGNRLIGTVSLCPIQKENQPQRAEIYKLIVALSHRRKGIAAQLMQAAEQKARELGRTLLVLDTVPNTPASAFYEKHGWTAAGTIPSYAYMPDGKICAATYYWKKIGEVPPRI